MHMSRARPFTAALVLGVLSCGLVFASQVGARASSSADRNATRWGITDLGTLPGWPISEAFGVNDRGEIVGTGSREFGDDNQFVECHAAMWVGKTVTDISALLGAKGSCDIAINERGQVLTDEGLFGHAWVQEPGGKLTDLGVLPGEKYSQGIAINDREQVVGDNFTARPFVWERGAMRAIGRLGGALALATFALAINDRGWVIGSSGIRDAVTPSFGGTGE